MSPPRSVWRIVGNPTPSQSSRNFASRCPLSVLQLGQESRMRARLFSTHQKLSPVWGDNLAVQVGRAIYPVKNEEDLIWALNATRADLGGLELALKEEEDNAERLRSIEEECENIARKKANLAAYGSIAFFVGEFAFMGYGTFFLYSWDIMEPLAYMLGLVDVIAGYSFYAYYRTNYSAADLTQSFRKAAIRKVYECHQVNEVELPEAEERIRHLRRRLLAIKSII